jgi:hypothetical protein
MSGDSMTANHLEHKIATFPGSPGGGSTGGQARGRGGLGSLLGPSARSRSPLGASASTSYSAGRDIEAKLISEPSTGIKLDIAATVQIRPIATTTAIPIHARICIPSYVALSLPIEGSHIFSPPQCEAVHRFAKFFEAGPRKVKEIATNGQTGSHDEPNSAKQNT